MMISELDHRVKNNLAAVITLAEQTARAAETIPDFTAKFMGRIRALARMHGALAHMRWEGVGLRQLTQQTIEIYHSDRGCRVEMSGPDVTLPATAATPVAMTIHELATNAAKYGVLSADGGTLEVLWDVEARDSNQWLRLKWKERGGPAVRPPDRRGFGIELIEGGIAHELRGVVRLSFEPEGVVCDLQIPLDTR
jgi:two-component system CheB/CheR fusion protein